MFLCFLRAVAVHSYRKTPISHARSGASGWGGALKSTAIACATLVSGTVAIGFCSDSYRRSTTAKMLYLALSSRYVSFENHSYLTEFFHDFHRLSFPTPHFPFALRVAPLRDIGRDSYVLRPSRVQTANVANPRDRLRRDPSSSTHIENSFFSRPNSYAQVDAGFVTRFSSDGAQNGGVRLLDPGQAIQSASARPGGKIHEVPVHGKAEQYMDAYIEAAGIADQSRSPLWRKGLKHTGTLWNRSLTRFDVFQMIWRCAPAVGVSEEICCHTLLARPASPFTAKMAGHSPTRSTQLYDRSEHETSLRKFERVRL